MKLKPEERIEKYYACATSDEEMEDEDVECEEAEQDKAADGLVISQSKDNGENGSSDKAIDLDDDNDDDNELSLAKRVNLMALPFEVVKYWFEVIFVAKQYLGKKWRN